MQNPPPVQMTKSSTGLDENVAALLSYVLQWVSGLVFFLIEKESRLVRFHAMQSLLLSIVAFVVFMVMWFGWIVIMIVVSQISDALGALISIVLGLLFFVVGLAFFAGWIMGMIKAYQGQYFKLPLIGSFAEKFSAK